MRYLKNISPREYQEKIFKTCLEKNCLVILPTGLGKTLVALMLSIEYLEKFPLKKILLLAPTKPLAEQHLNYFKKNLPELFAEMNIFTGSVKPEKRRKIWEETNIIFSTPQCIANDLKKNLYDLSEVSLLIEDEAHRCIKNYDYNFIAQKHKQQSENSRIIGLTASPGNDITKIKEICRNLAIEKVELRTRDSEDVKKYLQELKFEKVVVELPEEFQQMKLTLNKLFTQYIEELKARNVFWGVPSKIGLIELQKKIIGTLSRGNKNFNYMLGASACAQAIKIQHALELLETQTLKSFNKYLNNLLKQADKKQSKGVVRLVSKDEFNFIYETSNELLAKNKEHPKLAKLYEIVEENTRKNPKSKIIIFSQFRDTASIISKELNKIKKIKSKIFIGQTKKDGEGLNQKEQKKILEDFSKGKINVLCATSIGEEGLDIPEVNTVIFYEPVPSVIRAIQRAGRTARLQKGKLIILITKQTRDETFYYVSRAKEKKMYKIVSGIKEDLDNKKINFKEIQKTLTANEKDI